ncbi:MAG: hypothetical protein AB7V77_03040 [Candidatus Woesearchaeota archaeon]
MVRETNNLSILSENKLNKDLNKGFDTLKNKYSKLNFLFSSKELFDRLGYGFVAYQFIIIFFFLMGAPIFLVGLISGLKDLLTSLLSSIIEEYYEFKNIKSIFISKAGILFGFSFLLMALAIRLKSVWLFSVSFLISSVGVVTYGHLYKKLMETSIKYERRSWFLQQITQYGLIITVIAFLISGYILNHVGLNDTLYTFTILGNTLSCPINAYLIIFEIAAILFIISGFILSKLPDLKSKEHYPFNSFFSAYIHKIVSEIKIFKQNSKLKYLLVGVVLISVIQTFANTYYGYYIYLQFKDVFFKGFLNIALIYSIAILISLISLKFTNILRNRFGSSPIVVFGTLLSAILPLVLIFNPHFYVVIVANAVFVIGTTMASYSQHYIVKNLLDQTQLKIYYKSIGFVMILPYLVLVPLGALVAQLLGLIILFKIIVLLLIFVYLPLNLTLVILSEK